MTKTKSVDRICVDSLPCAAAAIVSGGTLLQIKKVSPGRVEFVIEGDDLELIASDYTLGKLEVNARDFMRAFDDLRTLLRKGGVR